MRKRTGEAQVLIWSIFKAHTVGFNNAERDHIKLEHLAQLVIQH